MSERLLLGRQRRTLGLWSFVVAAALHIGSLAAAAQDVAATVPNLLNRSREQAEAALRNVGLNPLALVGSDAPDASQAGRVYFQLPNANQPATAGAQVAFAFYKGTAPPAMVAVPSLTNNSKSAADAALRTAGLIPNAQAGSAAPDPSRNGLVYSQNPAENSRTAPGSTVTFQFYRAAATPPPATTTSYWLGRRTAPGSSQLIYDVPVPDFFANWMKIRTAVGGGQRYQRSVGGRSYTFYKQFLVWDNGGANPETGQVAVNKGQGGTDLAWQFNQALKTNQYAALRRELHNLATKNSFNWSEVNPATIVEVPGSTSPSLVLDTSGPFDTVGAESEQKGFAAKQPQIVSVPLGNSLVVAWQQYTGGSSQGVKLTRVNPGGGSFTKAWQKDLPLDLLVGLTGDEANLYVVTAKKEDLGQDGTVLGFRPQVLVMTKFDSNGNQLWQRDLNSGNYLGGPDAQGKTPSAVFSPMTAGTGAVAYGDGKVAAIWASNTLPDGGGLRHQRAQFVVVNAADGSPAGTSGETSGRHSFDQRVIFDGSDFVIMDLGDAGWYLPAAGIALRKIKRQPVDGKTVLPPDAAGLYVYARQSETAGAQNFTFTSMGDIAPGNSGYTVLFSSERNNNISQRSGWNEPVLEPRNLGLVHVVQGFETVKDAIHKAGDAPDGREEFGNVCIDWRQGYVPYLMNITKNVVDSAGAPPRTYSRPGDANKKFTQTGIVWLTQYSSGVSVERPKLVRITDDRYVALWEEWSYSGTALQHQATKAMLVGEYGNVIAPATKINARLNPNGSDRPFPLNGNAAWLTGSSATGELTLNWVGPNLALQSVAVGL